MSFRHPTFCQCAAAAVLLMLLLIVPLIAGCASFDHPATADVLGRLPQREAVQVEVWSHEHPVIWTLRIHRPDSCPWFYAADWLTHSHENPWWADRIYRFYKAKHEEEDHCSCDLVLGTVQVLIECDPNSYE